MNRLHKTLERAAEEIENLYGKETELSNELREFIETADDLWEFAQAMPEYERLKERDRAKKPHRTDTSPCWLCCPNCKSKQTIEGMQFRKDVVEASQFCSKCGQRIDWSEEEGHEN